MYERLSQLETRTTRLMLWMVWILVVTALLLYGVKPVYQSYRQGQTSLTVLDNLADDKIQIDRDIALVRENLNLSRARLQGDTQDLPADQMESFFIGRLQGVSWKVGIELLGVKPGLATRVLGFDEVAFEIEIQGTYHQLYAWMQALNDELGFVLVKKYDIKTSGRQQAGEPLRMDLTLVFYRAG